MFSDRWHLRWEERAQKMPIYSCFDGRWAIEDVYDWTREPKICLFTLDLKADGHHTDAGKQFQTLAVRTINVEKRIVRQDGISTKCGLIDRERDRKRRWRYQVVEPMSTLSEVLTICRLSRKQRFTDELECEAYSLASSPTSLSALRSIESRAVSWYFADPSHKWLQYSIQERPCAWYRFRNCPKSSAYHSF